VSDSRDPRDPRDQPPPRAREARTWRRYLRFFGPRRADDLEDELRYHVEMRVRDYMARGFSESDAREATARRLGDLAHARAACHTIARRQDRRMTRTQSIDAFRQDLGFAWRTLRRQKGWTAVAVITLALGIGANAAMFSIVNHVLLHPIPYPHADRIGLVFQSPSEGTGNTGGVSVRILSMGRQVAAWREHNRSFEQLEPYIATDVTVERPDAAPAVAASAAVLPSFVRLTGHGPILGRMYTVDEARQDAGVVLISEGMWRRDFGAAPEVLGKSLRVDDRPLTIIGVMPGGVQLPRVSDNTTDLWLPLDLARRDDDGAMAVGLLRPGVSREAAARDLDAITARMQDATQGKPRFRATIMAPGEMVSYSQSLVLLSVAVGLVLLIACSNVAHLLLARAAGRQREMAIRTALGAGTGRLFRQLLTESLLLSLAGCAGGLLVGWTGLKLVIATRPEQLNDLSTARMDTTTLLVAIALALVSGVVFGAIGAVQARRHSTHESLKAGALSASATRSHGRLRALLVATEMALSTMLLVGASLLSRSVIHLQTMDAGFDTEGLYSVRVSLPQERYKSNEARAAFFERLTERARGLPGVTAVTAAGAAPPTMSFTIGALQIEGQPDPAPGTTALIASNGVRPNFFQVMGIRLVEGTTLTDTSASSRQVIVNEGFARKEWPGRSALGKRLRIVYQGRGEWSTVVGVAANAYLSGLTRQASDPLLYGPPSTMFSPSLVLRTTSTANLLPALGAIVRDVDAHLPPPQMTSADRAMRDSIARPRFTMFLLLTFTLIAVALAAIGLYGVLAYTVAQRTREIGIRVALGATRQRVARMVLSQGLVLALAGGAVGLLAARAGVQLLGSLLYGVEQTDATSFVLSAAVLLLIAVVACVVPVRRALAVDPLLAIRAD